MTVRVRFAPSPTGSLHPGSARTVLFNYLFAHRHNGAFILRIEDTDQSRFQESSLESILGGIRWLGLAWDEGPEVGGPHEPYFQSQRLDRYREVAERLVAAGNAYPCFCTRERLDDLRRQQEAEKHPTRYDRLCVALAREVVQQRVAAGEPHVIRMLIPEGKTVCADLLRGDLEFDNRSQDDQVLLKSDGFPTYHLAATVDDHLMEISHVIRGDEWLASFPKQVMLYRMLGWEPPEFAHLPLVLGPDKTKLSKRHGAVALLEYRDMGYLPEAMVNFLAFLGWSPGTGEESFSLEQLCQVFELEKVQVSPAVFDVAKLDSVNGQHIRALSPEEFVARLRPFTPGISEELLGRAAPLIHERIQRLTEAPDLLAFLLATPIEYPAELVPKKQDPATTAAALVRTRDLFENVEVGPGLEAPLRALAEGINWKAGDLFMALRVAITGTTVTPPLLESCALLGRDECLLRLDTAIAWLSRG